MIFADYREMPMTQAEQLRIDAERCFRLAQGIAEAKVCDELEKMGREFEREAEQLEADPISESAW